MNRLSFEYFHVPTYVPRNHLEIIDLLNFPCIANLYQLRQHYNQLAPQRFPHRKRDNNESKFPEAPTTDSRFSELAPRNEARRRFSLNQYVHPRIRTFRVARSFSGHHRDVQRAARV